MKNLAFEWYVVNYDFNTRKVEHFNIFRNIRVLEDTNKLCRDYKKKKMSFEEFTEELRKIIMWQEWSRCEYEIVVSDLFAKDDTEYYKIDCYWQAKPNIKIIAKYVLEEYYSKLKIELNTPEIEE